MARLMLLDIPPDPAGIGLALAVVFLVIGFIVLLAGGLVVFLWYRKRGMRGQVMIRPAALPAAGVARGQPSNPNQP
jgi:hypothetical protein